MPNYHRVNIDGKSVSETRVANAATYPGTLVYIDGDGEFAQAAGVTSGRLYVAEVGYHQGLKITEQNPIGDSMVGEYWEEGREFAVRVGAGTYKKDGNLSINSSGVIINTPTTTGTHVIVATSQDDVTLSGTDYIRIRVIDPRSVTVS